jgi:histidyl-tRNA synthetase
MTKPTLQTLKGFRDFLPKEKRARDYVASQIRRVFERFGFEPLETPTLEYADLLMDKYGDEADKLVYRFTDRGERDVALRYDQTVPTARVLSQYQNELGKGFRRYQIQNVFRADKPQKGRYREFTQCDADIFGVSAPLADAEILAVYSAIYRELSITDLVIEYNDRETLTTTLVPFASASIPVASIIQSIDKLDKQTPDEVAAELIAKGLTREQAQAALRAITSALPSPRLTEIIQAATTLGIPEESLRFKPALARGLDYYTGLIFEGKVPGFSGSVGGGGRYDQLIAGLGGPDVPAVGFGLGFDRTVEVLEARSLIPTTQATRALVTIFSPALQGQALQAAQKLREAGIPTELYPDPTDRLDKQFKYADKKGILYALVIGDSEVDEGNVTLKNLTTREQVTDKLDKLIELICNS